MGSYRHLPWSQQPHVVQNPRFPHGRGLPSAIDIGKPHVFAINDRIVPDSTWIANRIGNSGPVQVINTRRWKEFRREPYGDQVMVADLPGVWFAASHFRRPFSDWEHIVGDSVLFIAC